MVLAYCPVSACSVFVCGSILNRQQCFPCQTAIRKKYLKKFREEHGSVKQHTKRKFGPVFHLNDNPEKRCVWPAPQLFSYL